MFGPGISRADYTWRVSDMTEADVVRRVPALAEERLRVLTDAGAASAARGETVVLEPAAAAARIVAALRAWGYLDDR